MSVEFSGQTTRSGAGRCPAATALASFSVAVAWLTVTTQSLPSCAASEARTRGTLPWMAATTAVLALAGTGSSGSAAGRHETPAVAANATAATTTGRRRPARPSVSAATKTQASVAPARATTKESTGGPPIAAQPCVGSPAWLIASRPHGKPPHGQRSRNASAATHQRPRRPATRAG